MTTATLTVVPPAETMKTSIEIAELWMLAQSKGLHTAADWIVERLEQECAS